MMINSTGNATSKLPTKTKKDLFHSDMDVSLNGGTPKTPQNDHF